MAPNAFVSHCRLETDCCLRILKLSSWSITPILWIDTFQGLAVI